MKSNFQDDMKMNVKDKTVYELSLCPTGEQVTHLQNEMFF